MNPDGADEVAVVSAALVRTIAHASAIGATGRVNHEFVDLLIAARQLYVVLLELLLASEPDVPENVRGLATALGNNIDRLEAALQSMRTET